MDLLIIVFMLLSGKAEVTLLSFFVAVIVLIAGRQYYILIRYAITFGVLYFYYYAVTHMQIRTFLIAGGDDDLGEDAGHLVCHLHGHFPINDNH